MCVSWGTHSTLSPTVSDSASVYTSYVKDGHTKITYLRIRFYEMSVHGKSSEREGGLVVDGGCGEGGMWVTTGRHGISLQGGDNVLELNSDDSACAKYTCEDTEKH